MEKLKIRGNIAISDTGFVFDPTSGESFTLNPTGLEIIKLLKSDKTRDEIKHAILEKYETDSSGFDKAFDEFMTFLYDYRLTE